MIKSSLIASTLLLSAAASPALAGEPVLILKNYAGQITVETSPDAELKVTSKQRSNDVMVKEGSEKIVIDGGIRKHDDDRCRGYYGNLSWSWNDKKTKTKKIGGYDDLDELPNITVTGPETLTLIVENAIPFGTAGNLGSADIDFGHCGRLNVGDISGPASITISGSGNMEAGDVSELLAQITGSGDLDFEDVGDVDITVRGSGNVDFNDAKNVNLKISGSGDINMEDVSGTLFVKSSGSGDISADFVGQELTFEGRGSTDASIGDVNGRALIKLSGSGDVDINDGKVETLIISARGSSDVDFGGTAVNAKLTASGSSDIYVDKITGERETSTSGGGDIDIGG